MKHVSEIYTVEFLDILIDKLLTLDIFEDSVEVRQRIAFLLDVLEERKLQIKLELSQVDNSKGR